MDTYRVGNHQPQNVYRGEQYIGVMFTAEDAALAVEALNGPAMVLLPSDDLTPERVAEFNAALHEGHRGAWLPVAGLRNDRTYDEPVADTKVGPHPDRPVLHGRRARGPKPPPLGPGCICDGSGRTCPRHGAVM